MNRIRIHETALGRGRFTGADDDTTTTTERTDTMDFKKQLFDEAAAREAEFQRQLRGDFTPPSRPGDIDPTVSDNAVSARDAHLAREAARSRQPARGATREAVTDVEDDDEDGGTTSAAGSARDANLDRELRRSRQPAGAR